MGSFEITDLHVKPQGIGLVITSIAGAINATSEYQVFVREVNDALLPASSLNLQSLWMNSTHVLKETHLFVEECDLKVWSLCSGDGLRIINNIFQSRKVYEYTIYMVSSYLRFSKP